jgi:hypothetical protein
MIKEIIHEFWENELPKILPREAKIDSSDMIVDIVGIRRCGKTFLMLSKIKELLKKVDKKSIIYINFENRKLFPLKGEYFNEIIEFIYSEKLLEKGKVYLFLDEVQKIEGWEKYIRSIYDEFKGKIKIFVSGSNANLLSRDYGTLLTGRHLSKTLMPLSFMEFLKFRGFEVSSVLTEKEKADVKRFLEEYLKFGGFPEVVLSDNKEQILNQLFTDILSRDILSKNVRKERVLEEFSYYLAGNTSSLLSFNKMADYFKSRGIKISVPTIESYFGLIKNSFLFFDNLIFSYKIKDQFQNPRKVYCIDNGILNFMGLKFSKDYGKMYENAVFLKLKKDCFDAHSNPRSIFYWKNQQHEEVDFVVKDGLKIKQLIQVCYDVEKPDTKMREIKALVKASRELKCNNLLIITKDYEKEEKEKNSGKKIIFVPLWKWILEINSNKKEGGKRKIIN